MRFYVTKRFLFPSILLICQCFNFCCNIKSHLYCLKTKKKRKKKSFLKINGTSSLTSRRILFLSFSRSIWKKNETITYSNILSNHIDTQARLIFIHVSQIRQKSYDLLYAPTTLKRLSWRLNPHGRRPFPLSLNAPHGFTHHIVTAPQ